MDVKGYLKKHKNKIKNGTLLIGVAFMSYLIGKHNGATKMVTIIKEPLLTFLDKEDYKKFCDHFDDFHNIKRG